MSEQELQKTPVNTEKEETKEKDTQMQKTISAQDRYAGITEYDTPAYIERPKRFGDRKDGRRLRTLQSMTIAMPYFMKKRSDALNYFEDVIDITGAENFLQKAKAEGYTDMTILHVILAAYTRIVAERPGVNRFVSGQRIYARNNVQFVMAVKKEMTLESPDTMIKPIFDPRDTVYDVYKKFQLTAKKAIDNFTDFDGTAKWLRRLPRFLFRFAISLLNWLDYHGILPKFLLDVSPFHGSMIITSMGSLGIPAIYHHIYDFGNLPVFLSFGSIFSADAIKIDGTRERHHFVTLKAVTDERICDGYYYASAFKRLKRYLLHPEMLEKHPDKIVEDID